jgi:MerR family copper efflux transcriptional regulator
MSKPMTVGQLSRRTGVPIKVLREYERLGFIYTLGRSDSNYRLFDYSAVWCVHVVQSLRSLGLTLKEIQVVVAIYLERSEEPQGPPLSQQFDHALARVDARLAELQALRQRIVDFQVGHTAFLAGKSSLGPFAPDPRHAKPAREIAT